MPESMIIPLNSESTRSIFDIQKAISERGFYFFQWLSLDELGLAYERDYLNMIRAVSSPLIVASFIIGLVALSIGVPEGYLYHLTTVFIGTILMVIVGLLGYMLYRSWLYINGAHIIITSKYYISRREVIEKVDKEAVHSFFGVYEEAFKKKFPGIIQVKIENNNTFNTLINTLKNVIKLEKPEDLKPHWMKKNEKKYNFMLIPEFIEGLLYAIVAGILYMLGIMIISYIGKIFIRIIAIYLYKTESLEYRVHESFENISHISADIQKENSLLIGNLQGVVSTIGEEGILMKMSESTLRLDKLIQSIYTESSDLQKMLQESRFSNNYDFGKSDLWIRKQVYEPMNTLLKVMQESIKILINSISSLDKEIKKNFNNISPMLTLHQKRQKLTLQDIGETLHMIEKYSQDAL